ncbi:MAG TPA: MBL fold metallo-hydrolase [Vulgatibacter sp.]|nr:MBL fold metallo-hydrolase [Vulgatibacter sp.]
MPVRGGDAAIARLGVHRIPLPIPLPQAGGPVNVVAVEEDGGGIALFDAGLGTEDAEAALKAGLAAKGFRYEDVRRIFITHGHIDHYGLARKIRDVSGAEVFVHPRDRAKVSLPVHWLEGKDRHAAYLDRCGVDRASVEEMLTIAALQDRLAGRLEAPLGELAEGQRLAFARCEATILETPGHTPGLVCALLRAPGDEGPAVLLANDHLLEKVSPNPIFEVLPGGERFRALPTYFESLARVRDLDLSWVIPGHDACFQDHRRIIEGLVAFYDRRQEKIFGFLPPEGATPMDLVLSIFPKATSFDTFLMMGEILGNLDRLEEKGRAGMIERGGRMRWFRR